LVLDVRPNCHAGDAGAERSGETLVVVGGYGIDGTFVRPAHRFALDLTDETGRAHATWWLADRFLQSDSTRLCGVYWWAPQPMVLHFREDGDPLKHVSGRAEWCLGARFGGVYGQHFVPSTEACRVVGASGLHPDEDPEGTMADPDWHVVPSLADLDPNDPRTLPDGSRWIDAEALRRVCLHVAGLEVTRD
jgi:hypothetical protein